MMLLLSELVKSHSVLKSVNEVILVTELACLIALCFIVFLRYCGIYPDKTITQKDSSTIHSSQNTKTTKMSNDG